MSELDALKEVGTMRKFAQDDFIFREGETGNVMYIILSGRVDVYINSFNDFPIKVSEIGPGNFVGEMSLLDDQPRSATIIAGTDTIAMAIDKGNFQNFICRQPSLAYKIMKGLSTRVRHLNEELAKMKESGGKGRPAIEPDSQASTRKRDSSAPQASPSSQCPAAPETVKGALFPEGHKTYSVNAPAVYDTFIFSKDATCPVCGKQFKVKMPRMSKLRLDRVESDFRKVYVDFEPMWYSIWICPECLYSNFYFEYDSVSDKAVKPILEQAGRLKGKIKTDYAEPRTIDQVFTAYYLALSCADICKAPPLKRAKLWIQLSWLYKDVKDSEMFTAASMKALEYYYNALFKSNLNINDDQEQQLNLILGELYLVKGDEVGAQKHFYAAIKRNSGNPQYTQQAQDRLQSLKKKDGGRT